MLSFACHELVNSSLDECSSLAAAEATEAAAMAVLAAARRVASLAVVAGLPVVMVVCATGSAATARAAEAEPIRTERLVLGPRRLRCFWGGGRAQPTASLDRGVGITEGPGEGIGVMAVGRATVVGGWRHHGRRTTDTHSSCAGLARSWPRMNVSIVLRM